MNKDEYIELCQVEMMREFYEVHEDFFTENGCKLKAAYAINQSIQKDERYKTLLEKVVKAKEELNEYEFQIHYKKQINGSNG